jgi:hypothetical protein
MFSQPPNGIGMVVTKRWLHLREPKHYWFNQQLLSQMYVAIAR